MFSSHSPHQNRLLAALPAAVGERLFPHLEHVPMSPGEVLYESGTASRHVYFPTTAIVSLTRVRENGIAEETAMVGNEGVLGITLLMGGEAMSSLALVESAGFGYRLNARLLLEAFNQAGPVMHLLLRYMQALMTQMAQTAFCNHHHTLDQQFCRRLLLSLDRLHANETAMPQALPPSVPAGWHEGMTETAGKLQRAGLIHCGRGHITVLDRPALERRACECFAVVKEAFDRLLPYPFTRTTPHPAPPRFEHLEPMDWRARHLAPAYVDARKHP